jgi:hypothetical protein
VTATWDLIQRDLHCCGSANYSDWRALGHGVPDSCCKVSGVNQQGNALDTGVPDSCCKVSRVNQQDNALDTGVPDVS